MKAIILSGGRGTRLSPLTDKKPKPLVTVGGKSIIKILIESLARQKISECAVTLGYRADDIRQALGDEYAGVKITYFEEKEALGTAGGVKNCESFIDSDFLVISGDSLCDPDIESALACHKMSGNMATIVLTPCADVLEYGVVLLNKNGKVSGFSEKPAWEGVKSDLVNCGIYLFKKEILDMIPKNKAWDFSQNVFPEMLEKGMEINTYISHSFWCDVGNPWALYSCNMKTLSSDFFIRYKPKSVRISESAHISRSVVGEGTLIHPECDVRRSVIGENCRIGEGSELIGCIVGDRVKIGKGVRIERGAVIGDDSVISDYRLISEGKKLPADTHLEGDEISRSFTSSCTLWHDGGIILDPERPEDFFSLGRASRVLGENIGISYSPIRSAYLSATVVALGICWSGGNAVIFGDGKRRDSVFCAGALSLPTLFLEEWEGKIKAVFTNTDSLPLTRKKERELSSSFERPASALPSGEIKYFDGIDILERQYLTAIYDSPKNSFGRVRVKNNSDGMRFASLSPADTVLASDMAGDDFFIEISSRRERISLSFGKKKLDTEHIHALILKYLISKGRKEFILPASAPSALDSIARDSGAEITRICKSCENPSASSKAFADLWARDVFFAAALLYKVLESHGFSRERLERSVDSLPVFLRISKEVDTGNVAVGHIMKRLEEERNAHDRLDGLELVSEKGGIRVTPDSRNRIKILAEAQSLETANELCGFAEELIKRISQ
jgi:mannose-1-phosphate guanylyltransferase/phosphomannomutase